MNIKNTKLMNLLENINLSYEDIEVLNNFSLSIPENKITCIIGPSGCGKTSILDIVSGLKTVTEGKLFNTNDKIGYIFQEDRLLPWETVYNNIKLVKDEENKSEIFDLLNALDIMEFKDKFPDQLSGGMKQRCSLARGFYFNSSLLLMDEPFKSLDYDLRFNLIDYLKKLWFKKENTIIFVTHDIDEALLLGHRIIILSKRPSKILNTYDIDNDYFKRNINSESYIKFRSKIINEISS